MDRLARCIKKVAKTDFGFWILDFGSAKVDFGSGCRFCMVAKIYDRSAFARNSKVIATNTTYVARNSVLVRTPS